MVGARGTVLHRQGGRSFGKRDRKLQAEVDQDTKRRRGEALASGAIVPVVHGRPDMVCEDFPAMMAALESDVKAVRAVKKEEDHVAAASMKLWRNTDGVHCRDRLAVAIPELAPYITQFTGEARIGKASVLSWSYPATLAVPRAMAALEKDNKALHKDLLENWNDTIHGFLVHDEQPPIPDPPKRKPEEKWSCKEAKTCLCNEFGDDVWAMKLWFCKHMSKALGAKAPKELLDAGNIVLRITSEPVVSSSDDGDEGSEVEEDTFKFVHIPMMFFSPYKPWARECEWRDEYVDGRGNLHLYATDKYYTFIRLLKACWRQHATFDIRYYTLVDTEERIASFDPRHILVQPYDVDGGDSHVAPRRARRQRPLPPVPPAMEVLLGDLAAMGAEDDDECRELFTPPTSPEDHVSDPGEPERDDIESDGGVDVVVPNDGCSDEGEGVETESSHRSSEADETSIAEVASASSALSVHSFTSCLHICVLC